MSIFSQFDSDSQNLKEVNTQKVEGSTNYTACQSKRRDTLQLDLKEVPHLSLKNVQFKIIIKTFCKHWLVSLKITI